MNTVTLDNERIILDGLQAFAKRWGLKPNGILIHPKTFYTLGETYLHKAIFNGITIYRSPDIYENEIKFVI